MSRSICLLTALAAGLAIPVSSSAQDSKDLAAQARTVLKAHCFRCHSGPGSSSGYSFDATKQETLIKGTDGEDPIVVANSLEKSALAKAIQKRMPQRGSPEREAFGDEQRKIIERWIVAGAPAFPEAVNRPFLSLKATLTAIRDHLQKADRDTRSYMRYFSLIHAHNNPDLFEEDLNYHRAALAKVLNSLSWGRKVVTLEAVDANRTLYAFDLRQLDPDTNTGPARPGAWKNGTQWNRIVEVYPYGLRYGSHPNESLRDLDRDLIELSKCELPWVRADWFTATASRPPLYHDLLQLPVNARDLEHKLGVDIADNFLKDKLVRAGFAKSGVSGQNRMLERHEAVFGAYWKSYDFLPDNGRANLVRFPLGPLNLFPKGKNPSADQAFKHDGGEIIFNLPNGLQAYVLVNDKDDRINAGPIAVVSDDQRVSGTPEIVNGVSCMACHSQGMIPFKDYVRDHSAVFGAAEKKVKQLYREAKSMSELVEADRRRFLATLDPVISPFLRTEGDKSIPLSKLKEPVSEVVITPPPPSVPRNRDLQKHIPPGPKQPPTVPVHIDGSLVKARSDSPYSVEIRALPLADFKKRATTPRKAELKDGLAFVSIDKGELYEVRVVNHSSEEIAVSLAIDGIDQFTFSDDREPVVDKAGKPIPAPDGKPVIRPRFSRWIVRAGEASKPGEIIIRGWHKTVDPKRDDSVLSFLVTDYGKGASASPLFPGTSEGHVGLISVGIARSRPFDPGARGDRETGFGPPQKIEQVVVKRTIEPAHEIVTVRYLR